MSLSIFLIIIVFFLLLEFFFPREKYLFWKKSTAWDFIFAFINSYAFWLIPWEFDKYISSVIEIPKISLEGFDIIIQGVFLFLLFDFVRWCTHKSLHSFSWLWKIHKTHHTIEHLSFLRVLYYNPLENFIYMITTLPLYLFFGFDGRLIFIFAMIDSIIGYMNHSNTSLRLPDAVARIINTPQVHIWHHDESHEKGSAKNFGINLSLWDWIFGTLYINKKNPEKIGLQNS